MTSGGDDAGGTRAEMVEECTISSFDEDTLRHVPALSPRLATGYFLTGAAGLDAEEAVEVLGVGRRSPGEER